MGEPQSFMVHSIWTRCLTAPRGGRPPEPFNHQANLAFTSNSKEPRRSHCMRAPCGLCVCVLLWSVTAAAQPASNRPANVHDRDTADSQTLAPMTTKASDLAVGVRRAIWRGQTGTLPARTLAERVAPILW